MKLFNTLAKKLVAVAVAVTAVAGISTMAIAGFGPDRPTKVWDGQGFDYLTYNSIIDMPGKGPNDTKGDERDFLEGVQVGRDSTWTDPINNVEAGEVEVKIYMHNNAKTALNDAEGSPGIAKDVKVRVELPSGNSQTKDLRAFIAASNATPTSIFDTLTINGANGGDFSVEAVAGSGKLIENDQVIGTIDVAQLLAGGVALADQKGCSEFVREITFRIKTKVPSWTLDKKVSPYNKGEYAKTVNAMPGDKLDYILTFKNIGNTTLNTVVIGDRLPEDIKYVPGTTQWLSEHTEWKWKTVDFDNLFSGGLDIAGYNGYTLDAEGNRVYAEAHIRFVAEVAPAKDLECGNNTLTNIGFAKPADLGTIQSTADVTVNRTNCEEPETPVYTCTDVKLEKLGGRKIKTTVAYNGAPANRVVFKNIEYNFGDGSTPLVSTSNPVEYTYAKDGTYKVAAKVTFAVDGVNQTVSGDACSEVVTFTTTTDEKCPYNSTLAKNDPKCVKPKELPFTGSGSNIAMFLATSMVGMLIFRGLALRKN